MLNNKEAELTKNSYYEASALRPAARPPLQGRVVADVCVVGGGYAGLSSALELAQRGYSVVLLEARQMGWGASGRNGGQAIVGYASDDAIEQQLSPLEAKTAWLMSCEAITLLRQRIEQHQIDCDFVPGYMSLAVNAKKAAELQEWGAHIERQYQYKTHPITNHQVEQWISSKRFHSGLYDPLSGHLHPLKYCLGLARAAESAGVQVYENSAVIRMDQGDKPVLHTEQGQVECSFVILAGNVYLDQFAPGLAPELSTRIMPVGTYIIASDSLGEARANALIRYRAAVCDTNFVLDYFRLSADHRLIFGGKVSYSTATPLNLAQGMRQRMLAVFPQLADVAIPYAWGGFVDITINRGPDFGRISHNIYYLQGFSGHGLALTGLAGKLVAEAITGQAERFDLLARIKHHPFPGGKALRTPALVLGMLYYRLRDYL